MKIIPITYRTACEFVNTKHRHHKAPQGHKFSIGLGNQNGDLIGVAMVGRPVSRMLDDGFTVEVIRLATLGDKNACSMLYGACWRAAKAMGYKKIVTYILETEPGVSLRASGWVLENHTAGQVWNRPSRHRSQKSPYQLLNKQRWAKK